MNTYLHDQRSCMRRLSMKLTGFVFLLCTSLPAISQEVKMNNIAIADGVFKPNWKEVGDNYTTPAWFNEAKFGI